MVKEIVVNFLVLDDADHAAIDLRIEDFMLGWECIVVFHEGLTPEVKLLEIIFRIPENFLIVFEPIGELFILGNAILQVHLYILQIWIRFYTLFLQFVCFLS